jgi:hypothetical protein
LPRFIGGGRFQRAVIDLKAIWLLRFAVVMRNRAYRSRVKSKAISVIVFIRPSQQVTLPW